MRDKVCVYVLLAATQQTYEFRIPLDLTVGHVAHLMARLLEQREAPRFVAEDGLSLMLLDGTDAGTMIDAQETIRHVMHRGLLVDGTRLALA